MHILNRPIEKRIRAKLKHGKQDLQSSSSHRMFGFPWLTQMRFHLKTIKFRHEFLLKNNSRHSEIKTKSIIHLYYIFIWRLYYFVILKQYLLKCCNVLMYIHDYTVSIIVLTTHFMGTLCVRLRRFTKCSALSVFNHVPQALRFCGNHFDHPVLLTVISTGPGLIHTFFPAVLWTNLFTSGTWGKSIVFLGVVNGSLCVSVLASH